MMELEDLIKATLKANIVVLTYNPSFKQQVKVDPTLYQNIKIEDFIHKVYIHSARKLYSNVYLFEKSVTPLQTQKNNRELEMLVQECILTTIRESIPVEAILRAYMDETVEEDVVEEPVTQEPIDVVEEPVKQREPVVPNGKITVDDIKEVKDRGFSVNIPKTRSNTIERIGSQKIVKNGDNNKVFFKRD